MQENHTAVQTETIDGTLSLDIPEGFQQMSREELKQVYLTDRPESWGTRDKERHIMITVLWKRNPGILAVLADIRGLAHRNQLQTEKAYAGHDYLLEGFFSMRAEKVPLEGYRFSYCVNGTAQHAETILLKHRKTVYSITCAGRKENAGTDREMFRRIMESLRIS